MPNGEGAPLEIPPVTTPDVSQRGKLEAIGTQDSGIIEYLWAAFWSSLVDGLKIIIGLLANAFDEVISLVVPYLTASQGINTQGFYDLTAQLINDLLGVEVAGTDLSNAADQRGRIGAMQKVGADLFNTLAAEFVGQEPTAEGGTGIAGLPGAPGKPISPDQGVKAAQAFLGFLLSFAVRQGNVAVFTDALSFHLLGQIREYGEMMAKNLGLTRLARRAMQPFIQTLIATPLQQALNLQYRPHQMDEKQIATAYLRGDIDRSDFKKRLALQGFNDDDADLLIGDTYTRFNLAAVLLLHENGAITDKDLQDRIRALGFNTADLGLLIQARQLEAVQGADRKYAEILTDELLNHRLTQADFQDALATLRIPKLEADALTRNAAARIQARRKHLSLGFLKRAYLDATITLDEYLAHALDLGFTQDDVDILEVELLLEQKQHKDKAAEKARKVAAKAAGKARPTTPPSG